MAVTYAFDLFGLQDDFVGAEPDRLGEFSFLPFLQVPDQAGPTALGGLLENQGVVVWYGRLETEDFDQGAGLFTEAETRLDHFRIIEDDQRFFRQVAADVFEDIFPDFPILI